MSVLKRVARRASSIAIRALIGFCCTHHGLFFCVICFALVVVVVVEIFFLCVWFCRCYWGGDGGRDGDGRLVDEFWRVIFRDNMDQTRMWRTGAKEKRKQKGINLKKQKNFGRNEKFVRTGREIEGIF